jgi:hypothetical protein
VFNFCGKYTEETTIRELIGEDEWPVDIIGFLPYNSHINWRKE